MSTLPNLGLDSKNDQRSFAKKMEEYSKRAKAVSSNSGFIQRVSNNIPIVLLRNMCSFLDWKTHLSVFARVTTLWNAASKHASSWSMYAPDALDKLMEYSTCPTKHIKKFLDTYNFRTRILVLRIFFKTSVHPALKHKEFMSHVRTLDARYPQHHTIITTPPLDFTHCHQLETLRVDNADDLVIKSANIAKLVNLTNIHCKLGNRSSLFEFLGKNTPALRKVRIDTQFSLRMNDVRQIKHLPLEDFDVEIPGFYSMNAEQEGQMDFMYHCFPNLTSLTLSRLHMHPAILSKLHSFPKLCKLKIFCGGKNNVADSILQCLSKQLNLTSLVMIDNLLSGDRKPPSIQGLEQIRNMPLKEFQMQGMSNVDEKSVRLLASFQLETFGVEDCSSTDVKMFASSGLTKHVRHFHVFNTSACETDTATLLTDKTIFPVLETLHFGICQPTSGPLIIHLVKTPHIRQVCVSKHWLSRETIRMLESERPGVFCME